MHPKSFVGRDLPGPAGGAYSAPPDPLAGFKGPTSKEGVGGAERWGEALGPALHNLCMATPLIGIASLLCLQIIVSL